MMRDLRDPSFGAERRHLTVMFCDLVGSSALAAQFDPEDFREIIGAYQKTCAAVIDRFGGYLARYVGDGILAYFGYPESHEDDTERAIRAAFGIIESLPEINNSLSQYQRVTLAVRIGVASGLVVAGDIAGPGATEQHAVVGQTPNLAARLQTLAEPNSVLITSQTRQLLGEQFECESLGPHQFNGFSEPTIVWRVVQPLEGTRFEATHRRGSIPLVDRDSETKLLFECWRSAKEGKGQSVLLAGEAGIGKSRLAESFSERLANDPHVQLRYQCYSFSQSSAFHPIISELERASRHRREDTADQKFAKLQRLLESSSCNIQEALPLFASLLSIPANGHYTALQISPRQQKERTLSVLADRFVGLAHHQPVFALVEDMHWMDPSSQELFDLIWERIGTARILLLVTTRERHISLAWSKAEHASTIALNRLDHDDSVTMVTRVTRGKSLPPTVLEEIIQRTDGVPLHVEELTKSILDSCALDAGQDRKSPNGADVMRDLPVSLRGSLMARLDQLGQAKRIAQYASVIGREFSLRQVAEVSGLRAESLRSELERLVRSELIYQFGLVPDPTYAFKHALVQEAAHDSLLLKERRNLHLRAAKALQMQSPQLAETQPELLAHHYSQAGDVESAAQFWMIAGKRSIERCAFLEATSHLRKVLGILAGVPSSPERDEQELDVQMAIGSAITATSGYAAPEAGEAFDHALRLCRKLDRPQKLFATLYGVGGFHLMRTELDKTQQIGKEILAHAEAYGDATAKLLGLRLLAGTLFLRGDLLGARDHLHQVLALYDVDKHASMISLNSEDYLTTGLAYLSMVNTLLGNLNEAVEASDRSLAHSQQLGHLYSFAYAMSFCQFMHQLRRETASVRKRTAELIELSREQGYPLFLASARHLQGTAMVDDGEVREGLELLQNGTKEYVALGVSTYVPFGLGALATALGKAGMLDAAMATIKQAIMMADLSGEQWSKAELIRQQGELTLMAGGDSAEAEAFFQQAISIAQSQRAALWELRAANSLAKLRRDTKRIDEARTVLAAAYGKFAEGLDAPDLVEARELLSELDGAVGG
jgi:class 3 adenylate cyclase/predicted ATPase